MVIMVKVVVAIGMDIMAAMLIAAKVMVIIAAHIVVVMVTIIKVAGIFVKAIKMNLTIPV
jgi:hypothetical protein